MKRLTILSAAMLALSVAVNILGVTMRNAQAINPVKPYTFSPNTLIQSSQMNSDFDTLYNAFVGVAPVYNASGTLQSSGTVHFAYGTVSTGSATICTGEAECASLSVTLSGASVFTSSSTYSCYGNVENSNSLTTEIQYTSGTQFTVYINNPFTGSTTSGKYTADWLCEGY